MLLLFWKALGIAVEEIYNVKCYHTPQSPPRYLCGAEKGLTVINPYINWSEIPECSFFFTPSRVMGSCIFDGNLLAGTMYHGVYEVPWNYVMSRGCEVDSPKDISSQINLTYTTSSGLPSDEILTIDSQDQYLSVLTSSGLYWKKSGTESFLTCLTTEGRDVFMTDAPALYFAESNQLRIKYGEPVDLDTWDVTIPYSDSEINKIFVNSYNGVDTLFIATTSGLDVIEGSDTTSYYDVITGSKDLLSLAVELDSRMGWGHVFVGSAEGLNVINLKSNESETYIEYGGLPILSIGYDRFYSK
mgnify:CR=1 FL=1